MAEAGFPDGDPAQSRRSGPTSASPALDMRPALTCLIGVVLAIVLNKVTSYYTHTSHAPVKSLARACQTGHATNIIQGFAVGYEIDRDGDPRDRRRHHPVGALLLPARRRCSSPTAWP